MKAMLTALATFCALGAMSGAAWAGDVHVTLHHAQPRPGRILVTLQTQAQFLQGRGAYNLSVAPPTAEGDVTFVFPNVAPGDYALAVLHDEDGNFQMKMDDVGRPQEGWAFSNGGSLQGPPTFDVTKFTVGAADVTITTDLFYPYVAPAAPAAH